MTSIPISMPMQRTNLTLPILVGGATAGTFDLIAAYLTFGAQQMPRGIAALIGWPWLLAPALRPMSSGSSFTTSSRFQRPPSTACPAENSRS